MWYNAVKVQADCWDTELRSGSRFVCTQQGQPNCWQKPMQATKQQHVDFPGAWHRCQSLWALNPAAWRHRIFWKSFLQPLLSFTLPANEASLKKLHFVTPVNQTFQVLIAMFHVLIWSASEMWQFWWDMEGHRGEGWVFSFSLVWTDLITLGSKNSALTNTQIRGSKTRCDPTAEPRISYTMVTKAVTLSLKKLCIQTKQSTKVMNTKFQFGSQHK